jgi:anti-anti-sigma factor
MTALPDQQVLLPASDGQAILRRSGAGQEQVTTAGVASAKRRHAEDDLISPARLPVGDRGEVAVVSLRGEPGFSGASDLQACLSSIRRQARVRSVVDLARLPFIDGVCLGVLVRHCKEVQGQGGSFALARPQPAVREILSVTGLQTWFEVHDTVEAAVIGAGAR